MIDWWGLFHNAVWVLGLAVILAALGMASFRARTQGVRLRQVLGKSGFLLPFGAGMFLFCLGLMLSSHLWWQKALWGLLAVMFAGQVIWLWRDRSGEGTGREQETSEASHVNKPIKTSLEERG